MTQLVDVLLSLSLSVFVLAGCGSSEPSTGDSTDTSTGSSAEGLSGALPGGQNSAVQAPLVKSDNRTPEQVVTIFLESLQSGNDEQMKLMLTAAARENNHGMLAQRSNAKFERRFRAMEDAAGGHERLESMQLDEMEDLWQEIKKVAERENKN